MELFVRIGPGLREPPVRYAVQALLMPYCVRPVFLAESDRAGDGPLLIYSAQRPERPPERPTLHIAASRFFGEEYLQPASMPTRPTPRPAWTALGGLGTPVDPWLPVLFRGSGSGDAWYGRSKPGRSLLARTQADVVASAFFLLTCYEELFSNRRDVHDRYLAAASLLGSEGLLERPVVEEYRQLFGDWLESLGVRLALRDEPFRVMLTHDIDRTRRLSSLTQIIKETAGDCLVRREPIRALDGWTSYARKRLCGRADPFENYGYICRESQRRGLRSHFYFMVGGDAPQDNDYRLDDGEVRRGFEVIRRYGFEIGVHGCYNSYSNREMLIEQRRRLLAYHEPVTGGRQHFLRFRPPLTWRVQAEAGLRYDTTCAFAEREGFRCGTCRPFVPFDPQREELIPIVECPLSAMEVTFFYNRGLGHERSRALMIRLARTCRRFNGLFVLLWHNAALIRTQCGLYGRVLDDIASMSPVAVTAETIESWRSLWVDDA